MKPPLRNPQPPSPFLGGNGADDLPLGSDAGVEMERVWVARGRAGDVGAFEAIFRRYYQHLCAFAERLLHSPDASRDAVQDVFVAVWRQRDACQGCDNLRFYLFTAVRNRVLKLIRHQRVVERTRTRMTAEQRSPGTGSAPDTPDEELAAAELAATVELIIQQLPERSREAFLLHRREGLSYAEIADVMGVSARTVENHIARALRGLREGLSDWIA